MLGKYQRGKRELFFFIISCQDIFKVFLAPKQGTIVQDGQLKISKN